MAQTATNHGEEIGFVDAVYFDVNGRQAWRVITTSAHPSLSVGHWGTVEETLAEPHRLDWQVTAREYSDLYTLHGVRLDKMRVHLRRVVNQ